MNGKLLESCVNSSNQIIQRNIVDKQEKTVLGSDWPEKYWNGLNANT